MERMFGATCNAAPVTRSADVGTAEALATSAAAATELVLFFVDDDEAIFINPPSACGCAYVPIALSLARWVSF